MKSATFVAAAFLVAACATTSQPDYREASREMSDSLVSQLETRTDARGVRLEVKHFQTSGSALRTIKKKGRVYYDTTPFEDIHERFRYQLMADLAQRVRIVDAPRFSPSEKITPTAVLMGTVYYADEDKIVVQTRIVDPKTYEVLATADSEVTK